MKVSVCIEENIAQSFIFNIPDGVDAYEFIRGKYYKNEIVLESGEVQFKHMKIILLSGRNFKKYV